ncbi:flagellar filament capping protein FliD [Janthinobacterium sp. CG_S6]|uniref:flagellar filament capping protein FliD n=1 Tax=Janthinobacterium sp. CG_S6 TaxID=3071707 RepID=UPI002DF89E71|nr:flagellar hook-associated protein 2 [Janthinobacterium sp. CG_S6]
MGISVTGVGSNLDVNNIVSQLMASENAPLNLLKAKETTFNAKLSAYGTIQSALSTFQSALKALSTGALNAQTATSSNSTVLTASAGSTAVAGTYSIEVTQLAQRHKLSAANGLASTTAALGSGTMSIQIGSKPAVVIPTADYSLQGLSNAINAAGAGVSATIVNDGSTNRLVVTATDSGAANAITITADGGLSQFATSDPNMTVQQVPLDATLKIDNILVTKPSNTITDAVTGLTLNLVATNIGSTVKVAVARDPAAMKTAVTGFVEAYNALSASVTKLTAFDAAAKKGAVLVGDAGANSIMVALRKEMGTASSGGTLTRLSDIGVSFQRDGKLTVDDKKLTTALSGNVTDMVQLFTSTSGYGTRLTALTTEMLSSSGVVKTRQEGLKETIKNITDDQLDMQDHLAAVEKRYRKQFSTLDSTMSSLNGTRDFLTQQLAAIANNY